MSFRRVSQAVELRASSSPAAFFISTSAARIFSAALAGLTGSLSLPASAFRFFSAASAASLAISSGVSSSGRPSFLLRSRLSSASLARIFSRARASSLFSRARSSTFRRNCCSSSSFFAASSSFPERMRSCSRRRSSSRSSFSRFTLAFLRISSAAAFASAGDSFTFGSSFGIKSGVSMSASSPCSTSQFTACSRLLVPVA
mmetsp:Transcript_19997/g.60425  ORF Transcript_19997/g.60425 Transcript_19997/m.60425 type:complete len:201 (+) Transcript_19997:1123-1725(+)